MSTQRQMMEWLEYNELELLWGEIIIVNFDLRSQCCLAETENFFSIILLISGFIFNPGPPKFQAAVLLTAPKVRYFLRENTTITRIFSILLSQHDKGILQVAGVRKCFQAWKGVENMFVGFG